MSVDLLTPVVSSNVRRYGHLNNDALIIQFVSGDFYLYEDVPASVVDEFARAESKGSFLNQEIKQRYNVKPIDEETLNNLVDQFGIVGSLSVRAFLEPHEIAALMEQFPVFRIMF